MTRFSIAAVILILALCAAVVYLGAAYPGRSIEGMDCLDAYSHARSSTDTAIVDRQRARIVNDKLPSSLRCGDLRRARALPGHNRQAASPGQPTVR